MNEDVAAVSGPSAVAVRSRRWLIPVLGVVIVIAALVAMVVAPLISNRIAQDKRDEVAQDLEPFRSELLTYELSIVTVAAESRAYALTGDEEALVRYADLSQPLASLALQLRARGAEVGLIDEANDVAQLGEAYISVANRTVDARERGDEQEAVSLVEGEGPTRLATFLTAADALEEQAQSEIDRISAEINDTDRTQFIVLIIAGTLGTLAALVLVLFGLNNMRLVRRVESAQQQLESIVSTVPGVVWEAWGEPDAANQRIDFVSDYVETMLGYSKEEWLATPNFWLTIVHPDDQEKAARESGAIFESGLPGTNEFRWMAKDGRVLHVQAFSAVIKDEQGQPAGMRGVTIDVTAQRALEAAVAAERARLQAMIASVQYGVVDVDRMGLITYINPAAEELLGLTDSAMLGTDLHAALDERTPGGERMSVDVCPLCRAIHEGSSFRAEMGFCRDDGSVLPVELSATPIVPGDTATGTVIVFQDIRERLRREAMKDDFVAFASHELMNPLTSVKGFSQWLANRVVEMPRSFDLETQEAIETLNAEAQRMQHIVELFLDLTRIDSDRISLSLEVADLRRVVAERVEAVRLRHPDVEITYEEDGAAIEVDCDVERLHQIIANLLDNAAKYAGTPPLVAVSLAREDEQWALLRVKDNGNGIAEDDRPYIFERFYRSAGAGQKKGLGVGLFVARELTRALGGSLTYTTETGNGTEFLLRLPLTCEAPEATRDQSLTKV